MGPSDASHDDRALSEALLLASPDAVIVVNREGRIESATPPVERLFGYSPAELVGQPVEVLIPDDLRRVHESHRGRYSARPVSRAMGTGLVLFGRRRDGSTLPVDVSLSPFVIGGVEHVGAFVRDATQRRRGEDLLRFVNEISQHLLAGNPTAATLGLITRRARGLVGAAASWLVVPRGPDHLVVEAADGEGTEELVGSVLSATESISARTMAQARPIWIDDMAVEPEVVPAGRRLGLGPGLYLPMLAQDDVVGVLVLGRSGHDDPFDPSEVQTLEVFASAASIALSLGRARQEVESLRIVSEQERIARDLHDTVIQQLFALGMSLQSVLRLTEGVVAERVDEAVDAIDEVIREIRHTIFELNQPPSMRAGVQERLRDLVSAAAAQLGFGPRLAFRGDIERAVTPDLETHVVAVAREALSNVVRHALASSVDVVLAAGDGRVQLTVADDGIGPPVAPTAGQGLANLQERAEQLGGSFRLSARRAGGTLLEWEVPVAVAR